MLVRYPNLNPNPSRIAYCNPIESFGAARSMTVRAYDKTKCDQAEAFCGDTLDFTMPAPHDIAGTYSTTGCGP